MSAISPSRQAAFEILMAVERKKAHSDALLRRKAIDRLSVADRNLTWALVLGVLRWQIRLDNEIKRLLKRPNARLDAEVLIALRMGAFQLRFLQRIPARAAIDESVELAKQSGHRFAAAMVNAVLRKLANAQGNAIPENPGGPPAPVSGHEMKQLTALKGHDFRRAVKRNIAGPASAAEGGFSPSSERFPGFSAAFLAGEEGSVADFAAALAHPAWMVERWTDFYGVEAARAICRHGQEQPPLAVRFESARTEADLAREGIAFEPGSLLTAARVVTSGNITSTDAFRNGRLRMQDEGSQLVGELAACVGLEAAHPAKSILDACAAPGGKTLILAERNPEARIVACESNPRRLAELRERLSSYAGRIECRQADATKLNEDSAFDVVLADVPCSGTGTLGRNPEIRHRLQLEDLALHAERQRAILHSALRAVRPGGCVVYATCSLEPEENEEVVAAVLTESGNARQVPIETIVPSLLDRRILTPAGAEGLQACVTRDGALRLLPAAFQTDGFFVALLRRTAQNQATTSR